MGETATKKPRFIHSKLLVFTADPQKGVWAAYFYMCADWANRGWAFLQQKLRVDVEYDKNNQKTTHQMLGVGAGH